MSNRLIALAATLGIASLAAASLVGATVPSVSGPSIGGGMHGGGGGGADGARGGAAWRTVVLFAAVRRLVMSVVSLLS